MSDQLSAEILASLIKGFPTTRTTKQNVDPAVHFVYSRVKTFMKKKKLVKFFFFTFFMKSRIVVYKLASRYNTLVTRGGIIPSEDLLFFSTRLPPRSLSVKQTDGRRLL
jgi:hypothetical protein